jgi:hypothetical protein
MFIYNVTTLVDHVVHTNWVNWMQEKHIPEVMATGCFAKFQFVKILEIDETEGITYAVQYFIESKALYNLYIEKFAATLREDALKKWGSNISGFHSLMQFVN